MGKSFLFVPLAVLLLGLGFLSVINVDASSEYQKVDEQWLHSASLSKAQATQPTLSEPQRIIGMLSGQINGVKIKDAPLMAMLDPTTRRMTMELAAIPGKIRSSMRPLPFLIPPRCWAAHKPCEGLLEESMIEYATGEMLRIKLSFSSYKNGPLNVQVTLNGTLPDIPRSAEVTLDEQSFILGDENGRNTSPNQPAQSQHVSYRVNGEAFSYTWQAIHEQKERRASSLAEQSWQIKNPLVSYEPNSQRIRWEMTLLIGDLSSPTNRAPAGGLGGISGTVTAPDGTPLSNIEVTAYREQPWGWEFVGLITTDSSGNYQLLNLETALYRLRFWDYSGAYAFEYYDNALSLEEADDVPVIGDMVPNINAELSLAGHVTGTVTMYDGQPPDWADVRLYHLNGSNWEWVSDYGVGGSYDIGGLASGSYRLYTYGTYQGASFWEYYNNASDLNSATNITVSAGITTPNINVVLGDEGGRMTGTVTSETGTPLPNIEVTAYMSDGWSWYASRSTTTDGSGGYQLLSLDPSFYAIGFRDYNGTYAFEYYSNTTSLNNATLISVTTGVTVTNINAELSSPAGHVTGTVTMYDGQPPDGGYVYLYHLDGSNWEVVRYYGVGGSYDIGGLASGSYRLYASGSYQGAYFSEYYDNASDLNSATNITVSAGITTPNINVVLGDRGGRITGTVTSETGTPLPNIEVTAYMSDGWIWYPSRSTGTDNSGDYQFLALDPAYYKLRFRDNNGTYAFEYYNNTTSLNNATQISVTTGVTITNINAELSLAGHVTGTVTMYDGQPPDWAYVSLYHLNGSNWEEVGYFGYGYSYDIGGLASGSYRLYASGYYQGAFFSEYYNNASDLNSATDIAVTAGITTPDINVVFGDVFGRITGTVTAAGIPVADMRVDLYVDYSGYGEWWRLVYATTNSSGTYSIGGLGDGLYRVRFSDLNGTYATIFYDNKADLASADTVTVTNGAIVPNINANLTGAGSITGTITLSNSTRSLTNSNPAQNISVVAYRYNGSSWEGLGTARSNANGEYIIGGLLHGDYRLYFQDSTRAYRPEYYDNVSSIMSGTNVTVVTNTVTSNINAVLSPPAAPLADVTTGGSVTTDPSTGEMTISMRGGERSNTTIAVGDDCITCTGGITPTNVTLWLGNQSFPMTESPAGSGNYQVTIPANQITTGPLVVYWDCGGTAVEKTIGEIVLYDPSGYITDAETGDSIENATVMLYKVPNWLPDTDSETRNCRTINTRPGGAGGTWDDLPAAEQDLGVIVNPEIDLINGSSQISPTINPQLTDAEGYYGWDVAQGCWYVVVQAEGYQSKISAVVGVPPEVTDLDLALSPNQGPTPTPTGTPTTPATPTPTATGTPPTPTPTATGTPPTPTATGTTPATPTPTATGTPPTPTPTATPTVPGTSITLDSFDTAKREQLPLISSLLLAFIAIGSLLMRWRSRRS